MRAGLLCCALGACAATGPSGSAPAGADGAAGADDSAGQSDTSNAADGAVLVTGGRLPGAASPVSLLLEDGRITALNPADGQGVARTVDYSGRWLVPGFIDSHVHLAYLPEARAMADGGVVAAVDLAAPVDALGSDQAGLSMVWSGPMVTAVGGYPTQSWGRNGYGLEVTTPEEAVVAVQSLVDGGARVIKIPMDSSPGLADATVAAAVETAHELGVLVASHALDDASAARAATLGVDVLAHMPVRTLSDETVALWADKAVVPTLTAFGDSDEARNNLARLAAGGARILYGTDFGNTRTAGIQEQELRAMRDAGLSDEAVLAAGTTSPAQHWGFDGLGALEVGARASFLVVRADPVDDITTVADPEAVWLDGQER